MCCVEVCACVFNCLCEYVFLLYHTHTVNLDTQLVDDGYQIALCYLFIMACG